MAKSFPVAQHRRQQFERQLQTEGAHDRQMLCPAAASVVVRHALRVDEAVSALLGDAPDGDDVNVALLATCEKNHKNDVDKHNVWSYATQLRDAGYSVLVMEATSSLKKDDLPFRVDTESFFGTEKFQVERGARTSKDDDKVRAHKKSLDYATARITCFRVPDEGYDFGMHWRALHAMMKGDISSRVSRLVLANDSCWVTRNGLAPLFRWANAACQDAFWGITLSPESTAHIQSYFMGCFSKPVVARLLEFVCENDIWQYEHRTKTDIVRAFEIGLSRHMISRRVLLRTAYTHVGLVQAHLTRDCHVHNVGITLLKHASMDNNNEDVKEHVKRELGVLPRTRRGSNPAHSHWDVLLALGCPLLKKARLTLPPFRNGVHPEAFAKAYVFP